MASHRINLRGPWEFLWIEGHCAQSEEASRTGTVSMPRDWQAIFGDQDGTVQFCRKFHRPTNLEPHESVMIVLTEVRGAGTIQLNEFSLGSFSADGEAVEVDVTDRMNSFNILAIQIAFDPNGSAEHPGGLFGVVALEIRS